MNRSDHPNILIILANDHGYGDVSMHQGPHIQTPNMDRIARDGVCLRHFYANSSVCSPSRAALMTGRYPDRADVPGVIRTHSEDNWGYLRQDAASSAGHRSGAWSTEQGRGFSAHKYDLEAALTPRVDQIVQILIDVGTRHERTPAQVAIAWILDHPEVTAPILGADRPEQVDEAFAALDWRLPAEERAALDRVSEVQLPAKWA